MGAATTTAGLAIIAGAAAGAFFFREDIKNFFKSDEQKAADAKTTDSLANIGNAFADSITKISTAITGTNKNTSVTKTDALTQQRKFEIATDPNSDAGKFNPKGVIGFGFKALNGGAGLKDTPENRKLLGLEIEKAKNQQLVAVKENPKLNTVSTKRATRFNR